MKVIIKNPYNLSTEFYTFSDENLTIETLLQEKKINTTQYQTISNGKNIPLNSLLSNYNNEIIEFRLLLKGGKGGFGTLLKTQPARKKLTNNFDACRDLSGRRLGHVNQERKMREWEQQRNEESKIINKYNNGGKFEDIEKHLKKDKNIDIIKANKKFLKEQENIDKMINKTFKYLKQKRIRNENDIDKENKPKENLISINDINKNLKENFNSKEQLLELLLD